jgi:hypothetical protein
MCGRPAPTSTGTAGIESKATELHLGRLASLPALDTATEPAARYAATR